MRKGWIEVSLGELADFRNGMNFTQASRGQSIKIVGVGDFVSNEVLSDFSMTSSVILNGDINQEDLLQDNDLLFVRSNGNKALIGRCVLLQHVNEPLSFSGFTIRARVRSSSVDPSYLSKLVQSPLFKEHLHRQGGGSSITNLNQGTLSEFRFSLPPKVEQLAIAGILRTWDEAIEKLEALRAAKEMRLKALTFSMVFGTIQLSQFSRAGDTAAYKWFDLPGHWGCEPIAAISNEVSLRNGNDEHEVLSCTKYHGFVRSLDYFNKQVFSSDLSGYKVIRRGEFGFPSNHVEEGSIGLQNLVDTGLVSPIYTVFRFDPDKVDNNYAYAVLKTSLYRHIFEVSTSASVDRRGSLRWSEFSKIPFPLPPLDEQRAIVSVINTARADLEATKREITALSRQKRGLMQKLLTGEWRVSKVAKEDVDNV